METLVLHEFHARLGGSFGRVEGGEVVSDYGDARSEYHALRRTAAVVDLSSRGRLVLLGADRQKMLNGQVTNNVKDLEVGKGCYAALVNAKARILTDLYVFALPQETLLDFEPGLTAQVTERLEKFIVSDDVQIVDAAPHYGLLSIQGPRVDRVVEALGMFEKLPAEPLAFVTTNDPELGVMYLMNQSRAGTRGFDLFVPTTSLEAAATRLMAAMADMGGRMAGWNALEITRIEAGLPRYGIDMDATNLAPEAGIESRAISYTKGCYSGQEVIARIRTYGQVAKALRGMELTCDAGALPARGTRLFKDGRDVGYLTSVTWSPTLEKSIALGYVRKEANQVSTRLDVGEPGSATSAGIVPLPFIGPLFA